MFFSKNKACLSLGSLLKLKDFFEAKWQNPNQAKGLRAQLELKKKDSTIHFLVTLEVF